jgi:filamentous hemagglutinin family protein
MKYKKIFSSQSQIICRTRKSFWLAALLLAGREGDSFANPAGMTVVSGSGSAQQAGSQLNVTVSQVAILNWSSFNIKPGETTTFLQPSANSVVFNQIGGANPSQIFGNLNANGTVILANANGFYFGPNSMISVGGSFIATTAPIAPDFGAGSAWQFTGMPPLASIVNYGQIKVGAGKSLYLIAEQIENHGELAAPGGDVGLYAGESVLVSERPDGRGLSATMKVPGGSVNNFGQITADAGTIALQAQVVNQNGILQADSVQDKNGVIELVASDSLNLGADSQILARGDDSTPGSSGGTVTLKSGNNFSDSVGSQISVAGGSQGGNGGSVEISAENLGDIHSQLDGSAQAGFSGGKILIDPTDLTLNSSSLNPYSGFANILFVATGNITLSASTTWKLSSMIGQNTGQLTLEAGGDITFGTGAKITDANNWSVTLDAGYDAVNNVQSSSTGNINLTGGTAKSPSNPIQLSAGSLNLVAGNNITVGLGSVFTTGGGNIFAQAIAGNLNTGTGNGGYLYNSDGTVSIPNPGGIATAAGGDVTLIAGKNVISIPTLPQTTPNNQSVGASGAYGSGNVTVIAGNEVSGNYTLANGLGIILAGVLVSSAQASVLQNPGTDHTTVLSALESQAMQVQPIPNFNGNIGDSLNPVTLSLIKGSWNGWAANNVNLLEVNNPNGTFNGNTLPMPSGEFPGNEDDPVVPASTPFLFNYASDAAMHLWAGNGITLGSLSQSLQRLTGNSSMPSIYAPILSLDAGGGGVTVDSSLFLYPSSQGGLQITTRDGGNLVGALQSDSTKLVTLTMSDSGLPDWNTISDGGHAVAPWHLHDPNPVTLDISGSIGSFGLDVPTFAQITVDGAKPYIIGNQQISGTYNFGFSGRNLSTVSPANTTFINVNGDITYRGDLTPEPLSQSDALSSALFSTSADPSVTDKLRYDATSQKLIFIGVMSQTDLNFLLNPMVFVVDQNGNHVLGANGNPETTTLTLTAAQTAAINQLYTDSQTAKISNESLALAGPGIFKIDANNIDLGISGGITVNPLDSALAGISLHSAELDIHTSGDLQMTASKIANLGWSGDINLTVDSSLNVGGQFTAFDDPNVAKGIFTASGGNVSVIVSGDVNVNSSRIAAYNGGNLTVESLNGDVNAGVGGAGYVSVNAQQLEANGQLDFVTQSIPGSGILATTLPGSQALLGNILFEAPNGNILASKGGILQIGFNGKGNSSSIIVGSAGYILRAASGNIVTASALSPSQPNGQPFQVSLTAAERTDKPRTVVIGADRFQVSKAIWSELVAKLGLNPKKGQVIGVNGFASQTDFLAALNNTTGSSAIPIVQGNLVAAAASDPANTVMLGSQSIQVSDAVWSKLNSLLGLPPGNNQVIKLNVSSDAPDLAAYLQGTSSDLSKFIFATMSSPDRNIEAQGSGIIGNNINLLATGTIDGVVIGRQGITINAGQNVDVTAFSGGNVDINASGNISGTVISGGSVNASGDSITASLISESVSTSGNASGATEGIAQSNVAQNNPQTADNADAAAFKNGGQDDEEELKKKKNVTLAQKVSRVTVILPTKNN